MPKNARKLTGINFLHDLRTSNFADIFSIVSTIELLVVLLVIIITPRDGIKLAYRRAP